MSYSERVSHSAYERGDTWHGPITVLSGDRRDWRVEPSTLSVPCEQGPSRTVLTASGLIIKWTRFAVGFIGRHALKLHDSLFANEHYAVTVDAYSFKSALYPGSRAFSFLSYYRDLPPFYPPFFQIYIGRIYKIPPASSKIVYFIILIAVIVKVEPT